MDKDIVPDLLASIQAEFERSYSESEVVAAAFEALKSKQASYKTVNDLAIEVGKLRSEALGNSVTGANLPDGKMYYNVAKRVLETTLGRNHELITTYAADVQQFLNQEAGLGLKAQVPALNQDKIDGLVNRLSNAEDFESVKWLLGDPIVTFSQGIVDEAIRDNVKFHAELGLSPKIVREHTGHCCDWCRNLAGIYEYPNVPKDVYRRHGNCRCTVDYRTKDGKIKDIWSKVWRNKERRAKIEERKTKALSNFEDRRKLAGVIKGRPMTEQEANQSKPNINYGKSEGYETNCQTCVVSYEARLRGFDVTAKPNTKGSLLEKLSRQTNLAWRDPLTGTFPEYIVEKDTIYTPKKYYDYLKQTLEDDGRYTLQFTWKGRRNDGHIISMKKGKNGLPELYDPQIGRHYIGDEVMAYLKEFKYKRTYYGHTFATPPKILRVDKLEFHYPMVDNILEALE